MPLKGARGGKIDTRFMYGIFLGVIPHTGEFILGTDMGAVRARTVRRVPEPDRWDSAGIKWIAGTLWAPNGDDSEGPIAIRITRPDEHVPEAPPQPGFTSIARRTYLRKVDFTRHGFTETCRGCDAMRRGPMGSKSPQHTEACRKRMEEAMGGTDIGADRLAQPEQ